jgi:uncharacterized protein
MTESGAADVFYASRPGIQVDGRGQPSLEGGLLSLTVSETTEGLNRCEATFNNWGGDYLYFDRRVLDFGKPFKISIGAGSTAGTIFDGKITGLEATFPQVTPPEITVLAEDMLQNLRMVRRTRTFELVSDEDVIQQIASEHGLRADLDVNGPTYRVLAQINQSDLAFIRERARAADAQIWIEGDTLHAQARGRRNAGEVILVYGQTLFEFSVLADIAQQRTSLKVSGWDVSAKNTSEYQAAETAIQPELDGGRSGSSILQSSFGDRTESIVHKAPMNDQETQMVAEASYRSIARRFLTGRGICEGNAKIRAGAYLRMNGLGNLFNGRYYVCEVRHSFDMVYGLRTHFKVERAGLGS